MNCLSRMRLWTETVADTLGIGMKDRGSFDVCITIDVEHDCPPFLSTYRGIEQGMPKLLALFADQLALGDETPEVLPDLAADDRLEPRVILIDAKRHAPLG